ncbi:unnamed protein product [Victoria cruziana]
MGKSENESIEAASKEIGRQFKSLINTEDVETLNNLQLLVLGRLQDSNAVLSHFNEYSEQCFTEMASDFSRNTRLLKSMKSDLDHIFQKLRSMKAKILKHYPDAFQEASASQIVDDRPDLEIALPGKSTL